MIFAARSEPKAIVFLDTEALFELGPAKAFQRLGNQRLKLGEAITSQCNSSKEIGPIGHIGSILSFYSVTPSKISNLTLDWTVVVINFK